MHSTPITAAQLDALKRRAKLERRSDPAKTYNQHLNALAAALFGVRNYHELRQRLEVAAPQADTVLGPPASYMRLKLCEFSVIQDPRGMRLYMLCGQHSADGETPWLSGNDLVALQILAGDLALADFTPSEFDDYVASILKHASYADTLRVKHREDAGTLVAVKFIVAH